jgi:hypothetical protein
MSADDDVQVLELKTKVEVDKSMKLIDINGKKINFQSDCIVQSSSKEPFQIAIVNQEELDNGQINFEMFNKSFSRRVRYESENNEHVNHYIAFKKLKNDKDNDEKTIPCDIVIRLKELPMTQKRIPTPTPTYSPLPSPRHSQTHNPSPRHSQTYSPMPTSSPSNDDNDNDINDVNDIVEIIQTNKNDNNDNSIYRMIAIICFIVVIGMVVFRK